MASEVDICNLALSHIADEATVSGISPSDGSAQADHCARFYPVARGVCLESHAWNFATQRIALAEVDNPLDSWAYAYGLPAGCVQPLMVLLPETTNDNDGQDFIVETDEDGTAVLYTNVENAVLKYTVLVTNTTKYSQLFIDALAWLLASYLAGPITKDLKLAAGCYKMFNDIVAEAKRLDSAARKSNPYETYTPGSIAARA